MKVPRERWSPVDTARIRALWVAGARLCTIARLTGRSQSAVQNKALRMGLRRGR